MRALLLTSQIELPGTSFKPKHHIHYDYHASQNGLLSGCDKLPNDLKIDTLLFTGTHGNFNGTARLNGIPEADVVRLADGLQRKNKSRVKNIVFDCCDSAYFVPHFNNILDDEGVVYCNLSDGRLHIILDFLSDYQTYKKLTIGIVLFNIVSTMAKSDAIIKSDMIDDYVISYPAIYLKKSNTLYYHGQADQRLIDNLKSKKITVVEIPVLNDYLDKLLQSETPIEEELDTLTLTNNGLSDWYDLKQNLLLLEDKPSAFSDTELKMKLLALFEKHFKDKEKMSVEQYTKILFPLAKRLAKEGLNPIRILAMAACQYRLGYENDADIDIFSEAISQVLQVEFATNLLQIELTSELEKTPKPTALQLKNIEDHLRKYGKVILGDKFLQPLECIIQKILPKVSEIPSMQARSESKPIDVKAPRVTKPIEMNWLKALLRASFAGFMLAICLYFAPLVGISLSFYTLGIAAVAFSCLHLLIDILVFNTKTDRLNHYVKNDISTINEEKLKCFMEGASTTLSSTMADTFNYRTWLYMQDYYAGIAATQSNRSELIESVQKCHLIQ